MIPGETPFLRPFLSLSAGIIYENLFNTGNPLWVYVLILLCFLFFLFTPRYYRKLLQISLWFCVGLGWYSWARPEKIIIPATAAPMVIKISDTLSSNALQVKGIAEIHQPTVWQGQKIRFTIVDSLFASAYPVPGTLLLLPAVLGEHPAPHVPGGFNTKAYFENMGIFHDLRLYHPPYLKMVSPTISGSGQAFHLQARQYFLAKIQQSSMDSTLKGIAAALLLGYKKDVTPDTKSSFINSGTMHVLAVSGLHVGVIYIVLDFLLRIPRNNRYLRWGKFLLIIALLWFYTAITGFSASVLRSAIMFSAFQFAGIAGFRNQSLNTLCFAGFILLIMDPGMLFDAGFQLSFLAVGGILVLFPLIEKRWTPPHKILRYIWSSAGISLAAQFFTMPVSLFHFGQFPTYFLIANILIVPVSGFALQAGLAWGLLGDIPYLGGVLLWIFEKLTWLMFALAHFFAQLPFASVQGLHIYWPGLIAGYFLVISSVQYLQKTTIFLFRRLVISLILCGLAGITEQWLYKSKTRIHCYMHEQHFEIRQSASFQDAGNLIVSLPDSAFPNIEIHCQEQIIRLMQNPRAFNDFSQNSIPHSYIFREIPVLPDSLIPVFRKAEVIISCQWIPAAVEETMRVHQIRYWSIRKNGMYRWQDVGK